MHGLLVLDKPRGPTCQQILSRFRKAIPKTKVGYTGTLDPFATGVLPIFLGEATKLIPYIGEDRKIYEATLQLGEETDTLDCEGKVVREASIPSLNTEDLERCLVGFLGKHLQDPPKFSAIKVKGIPLYRFARKGIEVETKPRPIEIFFLRLLEWKAPTLKFVAEVSRGTYIRSLALDIAKALGTLGHLTELRRVKSGPFLIEDSLLWSEIEENLNNNNHIEIINKNRFFMRNYFKCFLLQNSTLKDRILQGQTIPLEGEMEFNPNTKTQAGQTLLVHFGSEALALSEQIISKIDQKPYLKPLRILRLPLF